MKNSLKIIGFLFIAGLTFVSSCDKVEFPNVLVTDLDTTLFPGSFIDYDFPEFEENTNTFRNVLIEDFTGHKCVGCPTAAAKAAEIEDANPGRVFVSSIHGSPNVDGHGSFQKVDDDYPVDFTNPQGTEISSTFFQLSVGFSANPAGCVNRVAGLDGGFFPEYAVWGDSAASVMASELKVNLQAKSNYYPETRGLFIHTEAEFLTDLEGTYNIVIYAQENKVIAPQKMPPLGDRNPTYVHHNVHIGNVYDETFGRALASGSISAGTKVNKDFTYVVPEGLGPDKMHFLVIAFNRETYEVLQVIEHDFE
jgi:hypothetical protein